MENQLVPIRDIEKMATVIARSNFFGVKTPEQAMALMLVAQAEGRHPASVAMDYHIIQGRPALKADTMLSRYQQAGGKIEWLDMTDEKVSANFIHPSSGSVKIEWDIKRATAAGLIQKEGGMFKKYPRQMLRSRVISEGVRASFPGVLGGMYTPEEVGQFGTEEVDVVVHDEKVEKAKIEVRDNLILQCEPIGQIDALAYAEALTIAKTSDNLADAEMKIKEARNVARVELNRQVKTHMATISMTKQTLDKECEKICNIKTWEALSLEQALQVWEKIH